ncbi:SH3 domain-containing protein [Sporomusa sp. KB1]|jgi:hypothetical protein|uniref:C40 family peptidase n=1 Tax=Sporomusa sp. KB1 TaxID=943346 RepID=UPI0011A9DD6D|nr:SH3 domain-containing protein [Sporomusa sp. KB1]TWH51581.1 Cell wall-associated hydrolases (invasion-associated proteins) [Sporomusa sp. KB1]TWH52159.1 Cell wall-associated hydrolases (invasion-associated proteins) [Sporomusa sp. KB1]
MKRLMLFVTMITLAAIVWPVAAADAYRVMPNVVPAMLNETYWISKLQEPNRVILEQKEIAAFNQAVIDKSPDTVFDLRQYPSKLSKEKLVSLITVPKQPEDREYVNGQTVTADYYSTLAAKCNIDAIAPSTLVRFAFTVTRANIRSYPSNDFVADKSDDHEFDLWQETAIDPAEPVVILHESLNKDWYYVQTYNYRGWLPAKALAIAVNRQEWLKYLDTAEFLTVTARKITIGDTVFAMGAKLPLADSKDSLLREKQGKTGNYAVKLPVRGPQGELVFELAAVPVDNQVVRGYLPYTRANIISQVFKLQGQRYGWGGMHDSWDCSSLVLDVYRSFGLKLPRNADEQELTAGRTIAFSGSDRVAQINKLEPGDAIYMPGHVMMYLGQEQDGRQYAIHSLGGYSTEAGRISVMRVIVSDLSIKTRSGKTFLNALTNGKQFQ